MPLNSHRRRTPTPTEKLKMLQQQQPSRILLRERHDKPSVPRRLQPHRNRLEPPSLRSPSNLYSSTLRSHSSTKAKSILAHRFKHPHKSPSPMNGGVAMLFHSSIDDERFEEDEDEPDQIWYYDQKAGMSHTHRESESDHGDREEGEQHECEEEAEEVDQREDDDNCDEERSNYEDTCSQGDAEDSVFRNNRSPTVSLAREDLIRVEITSSPLLGNPENNEDFVDVVEVSLKNTPSIDERLVDSSFTSKQDRYAELIESNTSIDSNSVVGIPREVKFPWQSYNIKSSSSVSSTISSLAFAMNRSFGASIG